MLKLEALKSAIRDPRFEIRNPKLEIGMIRNPQSSILNLNDPQFAIRDPRSAIRNPKSERGVALVVAIMFMVMVLLLGGAYLLLTISESRRAKVAEQYTEDFSIADGGVAQAHWRLQSDDTKFKAAVKDEGDSYFVITLPDESVCTVIVTTP